VSYPVNLAVAQDEGQNRLWGIPFLGVILRSILVIPHLIILFFVGIGVYIFVLVGWIPILLNGRQAGWAYTLVAGYLRLTARVSLYVLLMTGQYPPFGLSGDHAVSLTIEEGEAQNRLWGIPFFGIAVRWVLLIPHFIALWVLGIVVGILFLVDWIPVLLNGRQAPALVNLHAGFYRWTSRVTAYALLITGSYPPFSLSD
jgi:hypothetical protein